MRYESISNLCYKLKQSIKLVSRKSNDFSTFLKVDSFSLQKGLSYKFDNLQLTNIVWLYRLQNYPLLKWTTFNIMSSTYVCRIYDEINYRLESCPFIYFDAHDIYNDNWHCSTVLSSVQPLFFCKPSAPNLKTTNNPIRRLQMIASSIV